MFVLNAVQTKAIKYVLSLSEDRLNSALDYLRYLYEKQYPLDDYDYELARQVDEDTDTDTIPFEDLLIKYELTYDELQDSV